MNACPDNTNDNQVIDVPWQNRGNHDSGIRNISKQNFTRNAISIILISQNLDGQENTNGLVAGKDRKHHAQDACLLDELTRALDGLDKFADNDIDNAAMDE